MNYFIFGIVYATYWFANQMRQWMRQWMSYSLHCEVDGNRPHKINLLSNTWNIAKYELQYVMWIAGVELRFWNQPASHMMTKYQFLPVTSKFSSKRLTMSKLPEDSKNIPEKELTKELHQERKYRCIFSQSIHLSQSTVSGGEWPVTGHYFLKYGTWLIVYCELCGVRSSHISDSI